MALNGMTRKWGPNCFVQQNFVLFPCVPRPVKLTPMVVTGMDRKWEPKFLYSIDYITDTW